MPVLEEVDSPLQGAASSRGGACAGKPLYQPTNVHAVWLQQELYLAKYWALLARKKPIGLVQRRSCHGANRDSQPDLKHVFSRFRLCLVNCVVSSLSDLTHPLSMLRCLFSFGAQRQAQDQKCAAFFESETVPLLKTLFGNALEQFGPKAAGAEGRSLKLRSAETAVLPKIEELLAMFAGRATLSTTIRDAMPKCMCWLGTVDEGDRKTTLVSILRRSTLAGVWHLWKLLRFAPTKGLLHVCWAALLQRLLSAGEDVVANWAPR